MKYRGSSSSKRFATRINSSAPGSGSGKALPGTRSCSSAPHLGSATYGAREGMAELVAKNLIAFKNGQVPPTLVNREVVKVRKPGFD